MEKTTLEVSVIGFTVGTLFTDWSVPASLWPVDKYAGWMRDSGEYLYTFNFPKHIVTILP